MRQQDFPVLDHPDLTQRVYQILRQRILSLELTSGARLDVRRVARAMGISNTPVKAAFDRLALEGMLRIEPRRGTFVAPVRVEDIEDLYGVRRAYEVHAAEVGCLRATNEQVAELERARESFDTLSRRKGDSGFSPEALVHADWEFHLCLVRLCGNRQLLSLYEALNFPMLLLRRAFLTRLAGDRTPLTREEHAAIFAAYRQRDVEAVRKAVTRHTESSLQATKLRLQLRLQEIKAEETATAKLAGGGQ